MAGNRDREDKVKIKPRTWGDDEEGIEIKGLQEGEELTLGGVLGALAGALFKGAADQAQEKTKHKNDLRASLGDKSVGELEVLQEYIEGEIREAQETFDNRKTSPTGTEGRTLPPQLEALMPPDPLQDKIKDLKLFLLEIKLKIKQKAVPLPVRSATQRKIDRRRAIEDERDNELANAKTEEERKWIERFYRQELDKLTENS